MKKTIATIAAASVATLALAVGIPAGAHAATAPGLTAKRAALLADHLKDRNAKCGKHSLTVSVGLSRAAQAHSAEMANRHYISHSSFNGEQWFHRIARYTHLPLGGENVGTGQATPAEVMQDWKDSPGHWRNIMDCTFKYVGFGYALGADGDTAWTTDFAYSTH